MFRGTDGSAPIRSMRELWESTRLRAEAARPATASVLPKGGEPARWLDVMQDILSVGYGRKRESRFHLGVWTQSTLRTCPSAGALYPLDIIVAIAAHHPDGGNYLFSVDDGLVPYHSRPLETQDIAAALGIEERSSPLIEAAILLLARPWISMAKYGLRGYIYCHLDAGHAASNLGIYARALGAEIGTHVRFSRAAVTECLNLAGTCREPLIVLSLMQREQSMPLGRTGSKPSRSQIATATNLRNASLAARLEPPSTEEQVNWARFNALTSYNSAHHHPATVIASSSGLQQAIQRPPLSLPKPLPVSSSVADIRAAIMRRRSAKGFEDAPVDIEQLGALLANLSDTSSDCSATTVGLRLTLLSRAIRGLDAGAYSCDLRQHAVCKLDSTTQSYDFQGACMGQSLARTAAALILFHVPLGSLFAKIGTTALAESHFQAAQLAQQMYLTAARIGLGITCIGGFDEVRLAALANLPVREEVIYLVALGVADDRVRKEDRLEVAFSHGFDRKPESRSA